MALKRFTVIVFNVVLLFKAGIVFDNNILESLFSDQFKTTIKHFKMVAYSMDIIRQSACLILNPMLRHKDGQDGRAKILLEDPCYALTIPPGKNNARN